jgi:hypothetical protein
MILAASTTDAVVGHVTAGHVASSLNMIEASCVACSVQAADPATR